MYQGELCKKAVEGSLLLCVSAGNIAKVLFEVHNGWCDSHIGGRSLAMKITRTGFFWPTLSKDAMFAKPNPFAMWGIYLVGKLPKVKGGVEYDVVTVEYFQELPTVLWSLRTTPSHASGETPFALVYGTNVVLPIEVGLPSYQQRGFDEEENSQWIKQTLTDVEGCPF
ncbi:hypothetical protein LIER_42774 [Lithospermum erythrorhizon]|uniref:Uncharacterized protein n=1 Tax=Lithospermum erythrorhizon TaxID=34254 RepID=A0AAV3NYV7_LITER